MIILLAFLLGALFGWRRAKARGGDRLDGFQYAAVHGILFAIVALVVIVGLQNAGVL